MFRDRVVVLSNALRSRADYVLYWMQSQRRVHSNLALEHALGIANERRLPLVIYESLRPDYPAANDRIHTFMLQGAADNAGDAKRRGLRHHFFLPRTRDEARGALKRVAQRAALVVTDENPTFIFAAQTKSFAENNPDIGVITVDGNGVLPMRVAGREMYSAKIFRDIVRKQLGDYWEPIEEAKPRVRMFRGEIPLDAWDGKDVDRAVCECEIDHSVTPVERRGGRVAALERLESFIGEGLETYPKTQSGLSPYLHFGFVGAQEVAERVRDSGASSENIDAFLEQLIVRRELSFNFCFYNKHHASLRSLPDWAKKTLKKHADDRRSPTFTRKEMEEAQTYHEAWNRSQRQLLETGTIDNRLRMIWGKKIIEWSPTIQKAHRLMIEMHDRYAIDGRDPNTHAGVMWCFGKHDRAWGERPIFGTVRYMR